jgi:AP-2 complex subunit alpha
LFRQQLSSYDPELQQRAVEYLALNQKADEELLNTVFDVMPNFPQRESALIKRIKKVLFVVPA